jgi:hypothetical protein
MKVSPLQRSVKRITTPTAPSSQGNGNGISKQQLVENENPLAAAVAGGGGGGGGSPRRLLLLPPPPIPPRSKLRPSPLRVSRTVEDGRWDGVDGCGYSVLSSPGLTEAVRRQFGDVLLGGVERGEGYAERVGGFDEGAAFI